MVKLKRQSLRTLKAKWRSQIMLDLELSAEARVVGWFMADRMTMNVTDKRYRDEGIIVVFGSQKVLATNTGLTEWAVGQAIAELRREKHLKRISRGRWDRSNEYQIIFQSTGART
jgi:hypothetical protein